MDEERRGRGYVPETNNKRSHTVIRRSSGQQLC